jgi:hypothetical protein
VAGFVDADEAEFRGLFDLPVCYAVAGLDVDVAGLREAVMVDFFGNGLPTDPVAVVVGL